MTAYKAWAIRMGSGEFLELDSGHVELFVTRREARDELAEYKSICAAFGGADSVKDWRVARVDVEVREIY